MPDAPGSGALNAGYAVTYGNEGDMQRMNFVNMLQQQNETRQQRAEAQRRADEAHRFALQKYYGDQIDPSKFNTQTDLDKNINEDALGYNKGLIDLLSKGASQPDIDRFINEAVGNLQKKYQIGTAVKRNIDASLEGLKGDKVLAPYLGSLKSQAYLDAFYTKDPTTGKLVQKDPSQIDPNVNYAAEVLKNHAGTVISGDVDWNGMQKLFMPKSQELSGAHYTSPGVKSKHDFKATWLDGLQDLVRDDKGVYHVTTVSDPIITKDANGKEVKIDALPQSAVNTMQSTPGMKAKLDVATEQYLAKHSPEVSVPPGTPAFENAKRVMAYQMMKDFSAKAISDKSDESRAGLRIRMDMGVPMPGAQTTSNSDLKADISASFKDITDVPFTGSNGVQGKIVDGRLQVNKINKFFGTSYNGGEITGTIPLDLIPASVFRAVKTYIADSDIKGETVPEKRSDGTPTGKELPTGLVRVRVNNGDITAIKTDKGWFDVGARENSDINTINKTKSIKNKIPQKLPDAKSVSPTKGGNVYVETRVVNGVKWGKKADGTIEKIQ